jgi:hypothetical protein
MASNKYIQSRIRAFARANDLKPADVDPIHRHYVRGLELLHAGNRSDNFDILPIEMKRIVLDWIRSTFDHSSTTKSCPGTSYGLKHWFGNEGTDEQSWWHNPDGFYIMNGQFKGAMVAAGFDPVNPGETNCVYRIKLKPNVKRAMARCAKHSRRFDPGTDAHLT